MEASPRCIAELWAECEVLVGMSLPIYVAALVAVFGDRIRLSVGR